VLLSLFYASTDNPESDFFLFFYLPVLTATEYMGIQAMLFTGIAVAVAFAWVLTTQHAPLLLRTPTGSELIFRVLIPREIFFVSVVQATCLLRLVEKLQRNRAVRSESELSHLLDFRIFVDQIYSEDQIFDQTISWAQKFELSDSANVFLPSRTSGVLELRHHTSEVSDDARATAEIVFEQRRFLDRILPDSSGYELCLPLEGTERVLGTISFARASRPYRSREMEILRMLVGHASCAIERARLLSAVHEIGQAASLTFTFDQELDALLDVLTQELYMEFATISLVDEFHERIETVRARNVPSDWTRRAVHSLHSNDIQAYVVNRRCLEIIEGWDPEGRLDREMFDAFGHENLARVFAPLWVGEKVVGTIEAGCVRKNSAQLLTPAAVRKIEALGRGRGERIWAAHPRALIASIANQVIQLVGAHSATLHLYERIPDSHGVNKIGQEILVAWAGAADKSFLKRFPPRRNGLGMRSIESREIEILDEPEELNRFHPPLYKEGVRSIAAVPLTAGGNYVGVLYVHYRNSVHKITDAECELLKVFAQQIEVTIHHYFLVKSLALLSMGGWTTSGFQSVIHSLASVQRDPDGILEELAAQVLTILGASNATLYRYSADSKSFSSPLVKAGIFLHPEEMTSPLQPGAAPLAIIEAGESRFCSDIYADLVLGNIPKDRTGFVEREQIASCAALVLKAPINNEIVGVVFVNYRSRTEFLPHFKKQIDVVAATLAIAIQTNLLQQQMKSSIVRRERELGVLHDLARTQAEGVPYGELERLLHHVLKNAISMTQAAAGAIVWYDPEQRLLTVQAHQGFPPPGPPKSQKLGESVVGYAAATGHSIRINDVELPKWANIYHRIRVETRSELAVPVVDGKGELRGVINLEADRLNAFSLEDVAFVEKLALQTMIAVHGVERDHKSDLKVRHLYSLNKVVNRIHDCRNLNIAIRMILTGITAAEGLGFSRCVLFRAYNHGTGLRGNMALGQVTRADADRVWKELDQMQNAWRVNIQDVLDQLLELAASREKKIQAGKAEEDPLCVAARKIVISDLSEAGVIGRCLRSGKVEIVRSYEDDPSRLIFAKLSDPPSATAAFVCAPLIGRDNGRDNQPLGVLLVDYCFLEGRENSIGPEERDGLRAYANSLTMTLENWESWQNVKMANFGEFTSRMGHMLVGGFLRPASNELRSLRETQRKPGLSGSDLNAHLEYFEAYLTDLRGFVQACQRLKPPRDSEYTNLTIRDVLGEAIHKAGLAGTEIGVQLNLKCHTDSPDVVRGIRSELVYSFLQILENSVRALEESLEPRIVISAEIEPNNGTRETWYRIEFTDNGCGVKSDLLERIFEPLFTTNQSSGGTGLGLAIVKQCITVVHRGEIEAVPNEPRGLRMIVRLPIGTVKEKGSERDDKVQHSDC
jgi:GAF domain-containing protein